MNGTVSSLSVTLLWEVPERDRSLFLFLGSPWPTDFGSITAEKVTLLLLRSSALPKSFTVKAANRAIVLHRMLISAIVVPSESSGCWVVMELTTISISPLKFDAALEPLPRPVVATIVPRAVTLST